MQTDYRSSTAFSEEEKTLVRRLLGLRAIAAFVIVGFIALIAVASVPDSDEGRAARVPTAAPDAASIDASLSALELGLVG